MGQLWGRSNFPDPIRRVFHRRPPGWPRHGAILHSPASAARRLSGPLTHLLLPRSGGGLASLGGPPRGSAPQAAAPKTGHSRVSVLL